MIYVLKASEEQEGIACCASHSGWKINEQAHLQEMVEGLCRAVVSVVWRRSESFCGATKHRMKVLRYNSSLWHSQMMQPTFKCSKQGKLLTTDAILPCRLCNGTEDL